MRINKAGLDLIKSFESCRLEAYKPLPTEQYYTIGYGHYGADVKKGMVISQAQADMYLIADVNKFESYVNALGLPFNENQFSALVSFTYNCGNGNLKKLVSNRNLEQIGNAILLYDKANGKALKGLTRRRNAERELYFKPCVPPTLKRGDKGEYVKLMQRKIGMPESEVDGIYGTNTEAMVKDYQKSHNLKVDGICGVNTWNILLR